ncbi:MAG: hypothetical protein JWM68_5827 [Verrucomicrobiales bacterium]|nr:hypothetical protein [Verrucomicrobiales bacterium]
MRINQPTHPLFLVVLMISLLQLRAEPTNIMVEDLTFTRPATWQWTGPTPNSPAVNRFIVPDTNGSSKVDVRFYIVKKGYTTERQAMRGQFPESKPNDLQEQEKIIGKQRIIYLQITGTYVFRDHAPKADEMQVGAAIPMGNQYVLARIAGPRSDVEAAMAAFKKMVEDAVKDHEEDVTL